MAVIKNLDALNSYREKTLAKQSKTHSSGEIEILVGMGSCGIAAGARHTLKAIQKAIKTEKLTGIVIKEVGCIGLCEKEPIIQVNVNGQPGIMYGKVSPEAAHRILKEHVLNGNIVENHVIYR